MINTVLFGDCRDSLRKMAEAGIVVQTCVTSPPYFGLRDYGHEGQIGLEETPEQYIAAMVEVFRCVRDVLADDGTLWVNIGDSYSSPVKGSGGTGKSTLSRHSEQGLLDSQQRQAMQPRKFKMGELKPKDLIGIPWMLAFALRADGWYLRQDIIWHKPNPMPESVTDRCTKAHEYVFLLSKGPRYFYDAEAVKEPAVYAGSGRDSKKRGEFNDKGQPEGREPFRAVTETRNRRSVWSIATRPYKGAHFAVFPPALVEPCILAGSREGEIVLDPFMGSGTTAAVAIQHGRNFIGCELNEEYRPLQDQRISDARSAFADSEAEKKRAAAQIDMFSEAA